MHKSIPIFQVDAFTSKPFAGNPAAVCLLDAPAEEKWMQSVAAEMNLSETAFIHPRPDGFGLRWFTPVTEVNLCGHATLATSHVLFETKRLAPEDTAIFHTPSGILKARQINDWIELDFPARGLEPIPEPAGLTEALGVHPLFLAKEKEDFLALVEDEATVRSLTPDFPALKQVDVRGIAVTARASTPGVDFVSRFFCPQVGINEDPVTGSAHCYLTPYWAERLGKTSLHALQVSSRGGELKLELVNGRVLIRGQAVTIFSGRLQS
jgi:PhzF family phenazine biosynthesis protein